MLDKAHFFISLYSSPRRFKAGSDVHLASHAKCRLHHLIDVSPGLRLDPAAGAVARVALRIGPAQFFQGAINKHRLDQLMAAEVRGFRPVAFRCFSCPSLTGLTASGTTLPIAVETTRKLFLPLVSGRRAVSERQSQ